MDNIVYSVVYYCKRVNQTSILGQGQRKQCFIYAVLELTSDYADGELHQVCSTNFVKHV